MAGEKTQAQIDAQIDAGIRTNGNKEITPPIHNAIEKALSNSYINKIDAGLVVQALLGYSTVLTPSDQKHFTPKKYVDDLIAALDYDGDYLRLDGLYPMEGNIDMDGFTLDNLENLTAGNTNTDVNSIPLVVDANSAHNTYLMALGKNGNSAYFRVDKDGNIVDIGGGTARILSSGGKPYFPDGLIVTAIESAADGNVDFKLNLSSGRPVSVDSSASTTDSQIAFSVIGNNAATKGNIQDWLLEDMTVVASVDKDGNFVTSVAGLGIKIKEGSNAKMGTATLSGGTVVVSTTAVTANSRIFLTVNGSALTNVDSVYVSARSAGTSFTISSLNVLDTSDVSWIIIEPS